MSLVVLLGVAGVYVSLDDYKNEKVERPTLRDHWHTAYGFFDCDEFAANLPQPERLIGIHTHNDGLIHVEPQNSADTGRNATVGRWVGGQPGFELDEDKISYPGAEPRKNGDKCDGKSATLQVRVWDSKESEDAKVITGDPKDVRLKDGMLITFAFVAEGTEIPKPPSVPALDDPNAGEQHDPSGATTTVPGGPATTAPGETTTTAPGGAPPESSTTVPPTTSTSAP